MNANILPDPDLVGGRRTLREEFTSRRRILRIEAGHGFPHHSRERRDPPERIERLVRVAPSQSSARGPASPVLPAGFVRTTRHAVDRFMERAGCPSLAEARAALGVMLQRSLPVLFYRTRKGTILLYPPHRLAGPWRLPLVENHLVTVSEVQPGEAVLALSRRRAAAERPSLPFFLPLGRLAAV